MTGRNLIFRQTGVHKEITDVTFTHYVTIPMDLKTILGNQGSKETVTIVLE